jgi:hypothetical protein
LNVNGWIGSWVVLCDLGCGEKDIDWEFFYYRTRRSSIRFADELLYVIRIVVYD